jgi:hypothetical protein
VVLQNGTCSFVSTNPDGGDDIPYFNSFAPGAGTVPATGATVWSIGQTIDGGGGGTVGLSIQAGYVGGVFSFLDTSATSASQLLEFDDSSGGLRAGSAAQSGDTFQWGATPAAQKPTTDIQPQGVRAQPHQRSR